MPAQSEFLAGGQGCWRYRSPLTDIPCALPRPIRSCILRLCASLTPCCPHRTALPCWPRSPFTVASISTFVADLKKSFHFFKTHPLLGITATPPSTESTQPTDSLSLTVQRLVDLLKQERTAVEIQEFVTNPRFDDPAYLTILALVLTAIFVTMSWFSRVGGGRFSPFGRPGNSHGGGEVSDADFSYITSEDLKQQQQKRPEIVDWDDKNPDRDTDVLVFKNGRTHYPTHFPAQSIRDGELKVGTVRQAAAKKLGIDDARRIRMFFKGKNLKQDDVTAREAGLRGDGTGSEILCAVGEAPVGNMAPGAEDSAQRAWSDGEDEEDDTESGVDSANNTATKKKPRKRGGRKNRKKNAPATASGTSTPGLAYSSAAPTGAEYLPIPSHLPGPRPTSAPPSSMPRGGSATPQTPMGKLDAIASKFNAEFAPLARAFMQSPPPGEKERQFEYKKLSESILTQILMKLDGVETEGDQEARMKRKELVREVQGTLNKLDETVK